MEKYKYSCSTMEVLLWESELSEKPNANLKTLAPHNGDLAFVSADKKVYVFSNGSWQERK